MIRPAELTDWWTDHRVAVQARAIEAVGVIAAPVVGWLMWRGWHDSSSVGWPLSARLAVLATLIAWPVGATGHAAVRSLSPLAWRDRWSACHPREVAGALHVQLCGWVERSHQR